MLVSGQLSLRLEQADEAHQAPTSSHINDKDSTQASGHSRTDNAICSGKSTMTLQHHGKSGRQLAAGRQTNKHMRCNNDPLRRDIYVRHDAFPLAHVNAI